MVTIREATEADAGAVLCVHVASIRGLAGSHYDDEQIGAWAARPDGTEPYLDSIADDRTRLVVAEDDGEVVGFGELDIDEGQVVAVYVHPEYAREGVGSRVLDALEGTATEHGIESLELEASLNAVPFYEGAGYAAVEEATHATTGGVELECVLMRKGLG